MVSPYKILFTCLFACYIPFLLIVSATPKKGTECRLREYNFTAVKKDSNGKRCRGKIQSSVCYGACETLEYGTAEFPHKAGVQTVCLYDTTTEKIAELKYCEPGALDEAKMFTYTDAVSCKCQGCSPTKANCVSGLEGERKKKFDFNADQNMNNVHAHWEDIRDTLMS